MWRRAGAALAGVRRHTPSLLLAEARRAAEAAPLWIGVVPLCSCSAPAAARTAVALAAWEPCFSVRAISSSGSATTTLEKSVQAAFEPDANVFEAKAKGKPFQAKARSLEVVHEPLDLSQLPWLQRIALKAIGYESNASTQIRSAELLYKQIQQQSLDERMFDAIQLKREFRAEFALMTVHVWLILHRLRGEGEQGKRMSQALYDIFWEDVEKRVYDAGVKVRVSKWLKELEEYFFGSCVAYDNALKSSPRELTSAVWRNAYNKEGSPKHAATLARYMHRELACLYLTPSDALLKGAVAFSKDFASEHLVSEDGTPQPNDQEVHTDAPLSTKT